VASSERNSFLATIASEYNFGFLQELPAGILAPYCSALFLAILLAGAADVDPEVLRVACRDMKKLYAEGPSIAENPACSLAAILAVAAASGRAGGDSFTFWRALRFRRWRWRGVR
jgi:hypothetical protein